ncbi:MAG: molybdate ABC transporter substrate-binding protein [Gemmatimonadetes bacterium]|nr:molybdate ABC transporter substrate-binding protein [Gemmatimonadota bacterium]
MRGRRVALAALLLTWSGCGPQAPPDVTVYAAASLGPALDEIAREFRRETGKRVVADYASSSVLARRLLAGAPADVFLSAHPRWMDRLESERRLEFATRSDLLGNGLVVVGPTGSGRTLSALEDLAGGEGRIAVGDPDHVPAGVYAKEALIAANVWERVAPRLIPAGDVRAALMLVERGECVAGIVYRSDAASSDRVRTLYEIPDDLHEPIVYPVAILRGHSTPASSAYLEFLRSDVAREVFRRYGFTVRSRAGVAAG